MKKNKGFLNYNTLKGRFIFALVFGLAIVIGFSIINSEVLKPDGLESDLRQMDQFLNSMSIFAFVYGVAFTFYAAMGAYDGINFVGSEKSYTPWIFSALMLALGLAQTLTGSNMIVRLLQMYGILHSREVSIFNSNYIFAPAITCLCLSLAMYFVRYLADLVNRKNHNKMMAEYDHLRAKQNQMKDFLKN
uniref:hypothetical protein n=1 Tax=Ezakiella massiliensis TaxID=1852374 RepID=UPI00094E3220|nr:hypothetical protein [Ezakiella massiliensis]